MFRLQIIELGEILFILASKYVFRKVASIIFDIKFKNIIYLVTTIGRQRILSEKLVTFYFISATKPLF